jgi:alkylation response protein AidB-like acyl-CoA dehydrogenase
LTDASHRRRVLRSSRLDDERLEATLMTTDTQSPAKQAPNRIRAARRSAKDPTDASSVLATVRDLAPSITRRSDEIEQARRIPVDLVEQLRDAGCFRMLVPARLGGVEADPASHSVMLRELARADGSVGWTVMIGSLTPVIAGMLPRESFDAAYAAGPDLIGAGTFNPKGVATPVDGGYRVSGQWSFASGCQHADVFVGHCMVDDGRMPPLRMMVMAPGDVDILDTWRVSGLCGTGSHDFAADGLFVPDARTFSIFDEDAGLEGPLGRIPELTLSSLMMASVAVGIAEGALHELTTLATGKVPMFADATLAANPLFRHDLGQASAHLRAAAKLVEGDIAWAWEIATGGGSFTPDVLAQLRSGAVWVATAAARIVDLAYTDGGGSSLYATSPLQRRLRDAHALTQHFAVKADTYTLAGAVLAGQDVDVSFL